MNYKIWRKGAKMEQYQRLEVTVVHIALFLHLVGEDCRFYGKLGNEFGNNMDHTQEVGTAWRQEKQMQICCCISKYFSKIQYW